MKQQASFAVIAAACAALFAAPALADNASGGDMHGMKMAAPHKQARHAGHGHARRASLQCTDYAWQSQDQKDCEAGKIKPPHGR